FFSYAIVADKNFDAGAQLVTDTVGTDTGSVKRFYASLPLAYGGGPDERQDFHLYFGPNNIDLLSQYDQNLEKTIAIGWGPLRYIALFFIWIFHLLEGATAN